MSAALAPHLEDAQLRAAVRQARARALRGALPSSHAPGGDILPAHAPWSILRDFTGCAARKRGGTSCGCTVCGFFGQLVSEVHAYVLNHHCFRTGVSGCKCFCRFAYHTAQLFHPQNPDMNPGVVWKVLIPPACIGSETLGGGSRQGGRKILQ